MTRAASAALFLLLSSSAAFAQAAPDAAGHWYGSVMMPNMEIEVVLDLARSATGELSGTVSMPAQKLLGLPLTKIQAKGADVAFAARTDQGFTGTITPDGRSMSGYYQVQDYTFPFILTRTGAAEIAPPPTSPRISSALEGTWNGTLTAGNARMRVVLTLANRPDGRSSGMVTNLDQGSLQIPVATITQTGSQVTLGFKVVESSFTGTLNAERGELTGTYTQGGASTPVTFTRQVPGR